MLWNFYIPVDGILRSGVQVLDILTVPRCSQSFTVPCLIFLSRSSCQTLHLFSSLQLARLVQDEHCVKTTIIIRIILNFPIVILPEAPDELTVE